MSQKLRIVVTGGAGKLGRACVDDLLEHGYDVLVIDRVPPTTKKCASIVVDLTDYGQVIDALSGGTEQGGPCDIHAVVHLAAVPAPRMKPNAETFRNNTVGDYNVFEAARRLGIKHVVYASSETVLGLPFDAPPPYVPIDEAAGPRPETAYSLSKLLAETVADQMCRWDASLKMVGLRFSNVMEPADYARFESFQNDARLRKWNLWGYIDARDGAQAIRLAVESKMTGAHVYVIANEETVMRRPNSELLDEVFPDVPRRATAGPNATLLSIDKAKRELGFAPKHAWHAGGASR